MRTTTRSGWRFTFTISDLGRLLGKSPVTIRVWDHKGLIDIPRDDRGDRQVYCNGVRDIAKFALASGRIHQGRHDIIVTIMTLLEYIERENDEKVKR